MSDWRKTKDGYRNTKTGEDIIINKKAYSNKYMAIKFASRTSNLGKRFSPDFDTLREAQAHVRRKLGLNSTKRKRKSKKRKKKSRRR